MESDRTTHPLAGLSGAARAPARTRLRVGVGAAVVLLIVALTAAVAISAIGGQAGRQVIEPGSPAGSAPPDVASTPGAGVDGGTGTGTGSGAIIFVHVLGAVQRPGLFELQDGARVMDAVAAAGGLTETADPAGANLARRLADGEQLYLPQIGEVPAAGPPAQAGATGPGVTGPGVTGPGAASGHKVNLNTATVTDLDTLPRIGPLMAQRILDYRDANGPFASPDDLRNVTGIGDKTFEGLKDLVTT